MFTLLHKEESSVVFVNATLKVKLINFNSVHSVVALKCTKKLLLARQFVMVTAFGAMTGKAVYNSPQWWSAHKPASSLTVKCTHHLYELHVKARARTHTHQHVAVWLHFWLYSATCRIICSISLSCSSLLSPQDVTCEQWISLATILLYL